MYSVFGLLLLPFLIGWATIPDLVEVYHSVTYSNPFQTSIFNLNLFEKTKGLSIVYTSLFGFGWGFGSVLFGLSVKYIGQGFSLLFGK